MSAASPSLPPVLVALMKGVLERDAHSETWRALLELQGPVRDYFAQVGLELMVDDVEGLAYLRQRPSDDPESPLPRLVARRPLSYPVSLLLALLRKRLAELDASTGETRLVLERGEIVDLLRVFLAGTGNEAKLVDRVDAHIHKLVELGFLQGLRGREDQYEVRRILKSFVDAQWLHDFERRLAEYREHARSDEEREP